jgi:hypothetical protein
VPAGVVLVNLLPRLVAVSGESLSESQKSELMFLPRCLLATHGKFLANLWPSESLQLCSASTIVPLTEFWLQALHSLA